ncbi:uncharacterized protein LOC119685956 [Teleopsis dalmanni]|uniref:uncharacterized protein LOC119685956 n=1 Tax=Teleopsis dalmanni TaxID=139649 RepID=UPI0018CD8437|nr:uncharacterized protein LOC119685956 [Teleopsis dalmanni]
MAKKEYFPFDLKEFMKELKYIKTLDDLALPPRQKVNSKGNSSDKVRSNRGLKVKNSKKSGKLSMSELNRKLRLDFNLTNDEIQSNQCTTSSAESCNRKSLKNPSLGIPPNDDFCWTTDPSGPFNKPLLGEGQLDDTQLWHFPSLSNSNSNLLQSINLDIHPTENPEKGSQILKQFNQESFCSNVACLQKSKRSSLSKDMSSEMLQKNTTEGFKKSCHCMQCGTQYDTPTVSTHLQLRMNADQSTSSFKCNTCGYVIMEKERLGHQVRHELYGSAYRPKPQQRKRYF